MDRWCRPRKRHDLRTMEVKPHGGFRLCREMNPSNDMKKLLEARVKWMYSEDQTQKNQHERQVGS